MKGYQDSLFNELIVDNFAGAVCPPVATGLIRANCPEMAYIKPLRTVAELNTAICG